MLSVGRREDGRKGIGLGFGGGGGGRGGMEENELEEGEACSGQDDDNCFDPDVALSYIDEKIQDVLGHFQKDFEGGVSAENLGAKFGGYGSFLPAYQRSPSVWSQPRSPPRVPNHNISISPHNSFEGARQNQSAPTSASVSKNNNVPPSQHLNNSGKISTSKFSAGEVVPQHYSTDKPVNGSDQKTLKVRIKVGSDNSSARNNAAIYSGLGLDISPSSSLEDSPDGSGGLSPEFQDAPDESPVTILQIMTCFSVPGGYLLSPLSDSVLHLSKKEDSFLKNNKTGVRQKGTPETWMAVADLTPPMRDVKGFIEKKTKPDDKRGRIKEAKNISNKDDTSTILKREIDNETLEGQKLISDALNISILSGSNVAGGKTDGQLINDSAKSTSRLSDHSNESHKFSVDRESSPDLLQDNQLESVENIQNRRIHHLGNEDTNSRGKLNPRKTLEEKPLEERSTSNHMDISSDAWREGTVTVEKNYDIGKSESVGCKSRKDYTAGSAEPLKQMSSKKPTLYEHDGERISQGKDQLSESKRKQKESRTNGTPVVELTKESLQGVLSMGQKEKKKSSHAKCDHPKNKSKTLKSHKEVSKGRSEESHRDVVSDINSEHMQYRADFLDTSGKYKPKNLKLEHQKRSSTFAEKSNDKPGVKKVNNPTVPEAFADAPVSAPLASNASNPDAAAALQAPVVIKENWVACDICQEWRLLPYGTDPTHLPKKWQCSMQTWLPGLNRCHVSEAETTKALNALYQIPALESDANLNGQHDATASTITSADVVHLDRKLEHNMSALPTVGKKKHGLKDESNVQTSAKSRSLNDMSEYPSETNLSNKFSLGNTSKSSDFTAEKHNHKQEKRLGRHSDGGDFIEKNGKHSKSKSKREGDTDGLRSSKKIKKEGSHYPVEDWHSNLDVAGRDAQSIDNGFSSKASGKSSQKYGDYSSSKDLKSDPKGHLPTSFKKLKDEVRALPSGDLKEHFSASDGEKSAAVDFSAKKRKIKAWQANQAHQETLMSSQHMMDDRVIAKEAFSESELRKQKKAKVSKSEGKDSGTSKADGRMEKCSSTRILLSGSREHPSNGMDDSRGLAGKEQLGQDQGNAISRRALDCTDYSKRELVYAQPPAAATSSSSKVSSSHKSKANFQEARGSPVESVSSSPLRISNSDKLSTTRSKIGRDDATNVGFSITGSPKRCSDGEVDGVSDRSGTRRKEIASSVEQRVLESHRASESGILDSLRGIHDFHDKDTNQLSSSKARDGLHLKSGAHDDISPALFEDVNVLGGIQNISDHNNKYNREAPHDDYTHDQDKMNNHHATGPNQRKSSKSSSSRVKEKHRSSKSDVSKGKLKVSDFIREQKESNSMKNSSSCRSEADIDSHGRSTYHEDLRDENYNAQMRKDEKGYSGKKDSFVKCSVVGQGDGHSNYGIPEKLDTRGPSMLPKQNKNFDLGVAGASCSKSNVQENLQQLPFQRDEKSSGHLLSDRIGQPEMASGRGKSQATQPSKDKQEAENWGPLAVPTPVKGSRSEVYPNDAVNGDASKVVKQSRKPDSQNGLRQATTNCIEASSPIRKDGHPAANVVLKEARDLKHTANRLKSEGLELESTGLYFEAALKFLHVASLLEPPSLENTKHGDANQSMQMYSETARLCEFCAHVYERCKEMAAAALAYKCVEVAYMKVAYYKHPGASKDRHELQAALQMVPPGESPSSSASDVDNLNNQGVVDKVAPAKGIASPQITGNHVRAARNRPNFMRLLSYTNDLNCAFEATRKSQNAIAAAIANLGKDGVDSISSVKQVLDFNFHNVEGLLRLVRLSMESISR